MRVTYSCSVAAIALAVLVACSSDPSGPDQRRGPLDNPGGNGGGGGGDVGTFTHPDGEVERSTPLGNRPFGLGLSSNGVFYITQLDGASMGHGTLPSLDIQGSVAVNAVPTNVIFDPEGTTAYVTNQWSQNIGVVDVASHTQIRTIPLPGDPFNLVLSKDRSTLYVTNNADNVAVINVSSGSMTTIAMPGDPNGLFLSPAGDRLYVSLPFQGVVAEIKIADNSVARSFAVGGQPQDMALSPDGGTLYIANESGSLDFLDLASGTIAARVPLPAGGFALKVTPDHEQIFVVQPGGYSGEGYLTIVNARTRAIVKSIELGGVPRKIAFTAHGEHAIVANEAGWVDFIK